MTTRTYRTVMLAATALLGAAGARGDDPARPIRIDAAIGALAGGTDARVERGGRTDTIEVDPGPAFAVGAGYALTRHLDAGGTLQLASDVPIFDSMSYTSVTAGLRWYPIGREHGVRPWVIGQAGWYRGRATDPNLLFGGATTDTDDGGGLAAGGGFDVPLGRLVSVGVDIRWNQTFGVFDDPGFVTTLGNVAFHFGG